MRADTGAPTEAVYAELLAGVAKENDGVRTRVVVDVVAGTSAGGINGIYLTKAIAHNLSQDALRDLWFDRGDMSQLLLLPTWLPVKLRFFLLLPRALKQVAASRRRRWRAGCSRRSRRWTTAAASRTSLDDARAARTAGSTSS